MIYNLIITSLLALGLIYVIYKYFTIGNNKIVEGKEENLASLYERKMYLFAAIIILISVVGRLDKLL